jgi:dephospho-CoA kinase
MIKAGITGNIGSGKSTVSRLFELFDVPVFYADQQARIISEHIDVLDEIRKKFGDKVIAPNGSLNRKAVAAIVFSDAEKLSALNAIIHPWVLVAFTEWCSLHQSAPYLLHESAILFESGLDYLCDRIILVTAPEEIRIHRVMQRDLLSRQEVIGRMHNQWPEERLLSLSDFEIVNDDCTSLIEQVVLMDSILKSKISRPNQQ